MQACSTRSVKSQPVDQALRRKARREKKSLNQLAIEALARCAGVDTDPSKPNVT